MNINDVIEDGNKYFKLESGKSVDVVFTNNFEKRVSDFNGKTSVKYECPCTINTPEGPISKTWSGSSKFYQDCMAVAEANACEFAKAIIKVTRQGEMMDTRYIPEFVGIINAGA